MFDLLDFTLHPHFSKVTSNVTPLSKNILSKTTKSLPILPAFDVIQFLAYSFPLLFVIYSYFALNNDKSDEVGEELEDFLRFTRELSKEREILRRQRNEELEKARQDENRIFNILLQNVRAHKEDDDRSRRFEDWLQMPD